MHRRLGNLVRGLLGWVLALAVVTAVQAQGVTLNMKEAELEAIISTVAEITGKNFIVDPRVKGKATIISSRPLDKEEVYQVFLSVLEVHGFSAVSSGKVIKIIPDANAKHTAPDRRSEARPRSDDIVTQVIQAEHVSAAQLVPILRPLVPPQGHLAAHPQSNTLIISDRAGNVERLVRLIRRIDQPSSGEVEVIQLEHASAGEIVRILTSLEQAAQRDPQAAKPMVIADDRTNSVLIGGEPSERLQMRTLIAHLDTPTEVTGNTRVVYLRYAKAKEMVEVLSGVAETQAKEQQRGKAPTPAAQAPYQIQADENTNALVITAPPDVFRSLESVIRQLDIRRAQVAVEAIIAEVSSEKAAELGVQWVVDARPGGRGPVGVVNFAGSGSGILQTAATIAGGGIPTLEGATIGLGIFDSDNINFATLLRALSGDGSTNVLSTPSLVTLDNQEAEIVVGQNVPFVTGSFTTATGGATPTNPFQTIRRENVGITLKVTPQINEGNAVKLDIEQKVDSISPSSQGAVDIVTNTRSIRTSVLVDDGKIIVLGGLIRDDLIENVQKVPLLGDIPVLGALFRYKSTKKVKTNLMVFLQPAILRDLEASQAITSSKYNYIRARQLDIRQKGVPLMPDEQAPLIPEFDQVQRPTPEVIPPLQRNGSDTQQSAPLQ